MTCQECALKLGMGEDAGEHTATCAECRALAEDLRLNAVALSEMRVRPGVYRWQWAMAAAAAIVMGIFAWKLTRVQKLTPPMVHIAAVAPARPIEKVVLAGHGPAPHRRVRKEKFEPLKVKMLTSDPDVVIYWIVARSEKEEKEGSE
jgi:hypothetical protein